MSNATYWRRRVFLLIGLLAVLTLIVFACRPSADDGEPSSATVDSSPEGESPDAGRPDPSISASPSPSDEPSDEPSAEDDSEDDSGGSGGSDDGSGGSGGGSNAGSGGAGGSGNQVPLADDCDLDDVVVTLTVDKNDYAWDVKPKFTLSVVNTGPRICTVDVGREAMELRVTSGDDRIWSTADCVKGDATDKKELSRGVPYPVDITWERKRSWTDCRDQNENARSGTYVVTLHSDYDKGDGVKKQVFRLN